ncbi:MAG: TraR/DksA C4-type zinc finger protein [Spirochaetia bacterium]|jgi:DnaK suppressor protein|nr:TraR/DksA C4-type zinc finger protein [Spirochaetia bacterium]
MTAKEIDKFRKLLSVTLTELKESIVYLTEASKPITPSCALGRLTRMEAIGEKGVNEAMLLNSKARLIRLENAMIRMEAGTYGICVKCKKEIPLGRLEAVPEALICINCA